MSAQAIGGVIVIILRGLAVAFWTGLAAGALLSFVCIVKGRRRAWAVAALVFSTMALAAALYTSAAPDQGCFVGWVPSLLVAGAAGVTAWALDVSILVQFISGRS